MPRKVNAPLPLMSEENFPAFFTISKEDFKKSTNTPYYIGLLVDYVIMIKPRRKLEKFGK